MGCERDVVRNVWGGRERGDVKNSERDSSNVMSCLFTSPWKEGRRAHFHITMSAKMPPLPHVMSDVGMGEGHLPSNYIIIEGQAHALF